MSTPEDVCNRIKKNLTGFEKDTFLPRFSCQRDNAPPVSVLLRFSSLITLVFLLKKFTTFSTKKVSQFAKEVHETFSKASFCTVFVNSASLAVNEKSYLFISPSPGYFR